MAPRTPSSKPIPNQATPSKTPHSKNRPNLTLKNTIPTPKENPQTDHPVEVIGRIRDYPNQKEKPLSALQISSDGHTIRVKTDIGYRDFSLDGVSISEEENLDGFYKKFVESRIIGVKMGAKCTIMMYGPTGSGKSHTMFGCSKQPGIVYRALRDILGEGDEEEITGNRGLGFGSFVQVTVLEIYNEEIYDLLSTNNGGGVSIGWPRGNASKVRLEVMGKKAKNATFISGNEAGKISREVAQVEKRRIIKSTLCNERSSRSHCLIILDVPSVGGRLMLVDMAGSENIEQAGQTGLEAKMQTGKINQGNIALKRVVESIANGDCHVPFRDSKLTMLLQDSFEDDKSKILMILCASPDPKEMHKTISTLEYGAKAKCIVRAKHTPVKGKTNPEDSKLAAMDEFIFKLQMENKLKEKECDKAHKELSRKEEEVEELRSKLKLLEGRESLPNEEEINSKVNERTQNLKLELEKKLQECQRMANELVELERRRMEEKILQQQEEVEMLRRRLEEIESELCHSKRNNGERLVEEMDGSGIMKRLSEIYVDGESGMEKSMDLDMGDQPTVHNVKEIDSKNNLDLNFWTVEDGDHFDAPKYVDKVCLNTIFEREEQGEDEENTDEEEMGKLVEEKEMHFSQRIGDSRIDDNTGSFVGSENLVHTPHYCREDMEEDDYSRNRLEKNDCEELTGGLENTKEAASARRLRIQNIFMLCGNHREVSQHVRTPTPAKKRPDGTEIRSSPLKPSKGFDAEPNMKELSEIQNFPQPELRPQNDSCPSNGTTKSIMESLSSALLEPFSSPQLTDEHKVMDSHLSRRHSSYETLQEQKENNRPINEEINGLTEVYVKWEATKENPGKLITKLKVQNDASLADLRKLIKKHLKEDDNNKHTFTFLMLGDPTGAPVVKEKEETIQASKLPICNNHINVRLACLRPNKKVIQHINHLPFTPLENSLLLASNSPSIIMPQGDDFSPKIGQKFSSTPFKAGLRI
ncbi:kinesin-like protein KIN-10A [Tasmannia lanceolata]|uniref:kinesin-like protein KIN-10A n=1 Tax=Tasmannia lanceolata TaxID=3420 RepID=UPI00406376E3